VSNIAKKHFGQHFLSNTGVIEKICNLCERISTTASPLLEIGPGQGALTAALLATKRKVIAYEIDLDMVAHLQKRFKKAIEEGQLKIIQGDFLDSNPESLRTHFNRNDVTAVGNLPYNVGSPITFKLLEELDFISAACLMLQKEVVQKFIAGPEDKKHYGPPSIKMKWLTHYKDHFWVSPGSFTPPPKVHSGVFAFNKKVDSTVFSSPITKDPFFKQASHLLHKAFSQRRKKLRNTLGDSIPEEFLGRRPEELSPDDYLCIAKSIKAS